MGIRLRVALALLVLAGCGDGAGRGTTRTGPHLDGTSWTGTRVSEGGADRPLAPGSTLRVDFSGGSVEVQAGCNHLHGSYRLSGDRLTVGPLASTAMGCDPALMEQDAWLADTVLASPLSVRLDGHTLTLSRPGLELVLTDRPTASPDVPLRDTAWQLDAIRDGDAVAGVPQGVRRPTLTVGQDGTVVLDTGCNSGGTTATVAGSTITFGPVITTKMACLDSTGRQTEAAVLAVLDGSVRWSVAGRTLTLTRGDRGLVYRVAP